MYKRVTTYLLFIGLLSSCTNHALKHPGRDDNKPLIYQVDLNDRADDIFKVTLKVNDLREENAVYQFAATAPGTYSVMDIGRFVRKFEAFDATGKAIPCQQVSTNQWQISAPELVTSIQYSIAETWDTPVETNPVFPMAGTSLEEDHVQLNGHCVFGYPTGMQGRALQIKLDYPNEWLLGTALRQDENGYYIADNYDHIVDSPFLMGRLSKAELEVNGSKVEIYTYSKTDQVKSDMILESVRDILLAATDFMNSLPVDRYTFLFHFEDLTYGAWEHSYSSTYTYREEGFERLLQQSIPEVVAHEFFHVVTPLNIHSEIIEQFNFVEPVASEHLWLYEGVTEWAANIMMLRSHLIELEDYLEQITTKLTTDERYDEDYSLSKLALTSFTPEGGQQYANIYQRGAIVAGLLDIRLLELSNGKRGLREVINELAKTYGPHKAFSEKTFFDDFAGMTFPQIRHFFDRYVRNTEPLPLADGFARLGITYTREQHTGEQITTAGLQLIAPAGKLTTTQVNDRLKEFGLRDGDVITGFNGQEVSLKNARTIFSGLRELDAGVPYTLTVSRTGETIELTCEKFMTEKINRHVLEVDEDATAEQLRLREAWLRNL